MKVRRIVIGLLVSAALVAGAALAVVSSTSSHPTGSNSATMVEYAMMAY